LSAACPFRVTPFPEWKRIGFRFGKLLKHNNLPAEANSLQVKLCEPKFPNPNRTKKC